MTSEERFWSKVRKNDTCWTWSAYRNPDGYGQCWFQGQMRLAHRVSFFLTYGRWPIPQTDHLCKVKECVRPDHLDEVTARQNNLRTHGTDTHCKHGHLRSPENTIRVGKNSSCCRECHREVSRRWNREHYR